MARINLLPWRQEERQRKNKEFNLVLLATVAVSALAIFLVFMFFNYRLESQNQANQLIKDKNAHLDTIITEISQLEEQREAMLEQIKVIQDLQGRRSVPVRIWDDIARAIPSSMYLVGISRQDDTITITGFADNANVVSTLVRNLDASPWLADSAVPNIKSNVEAYKATTPQANTDGQQRPIYPEDSYINFTVTTQVKADEKTTENQDELENGVIETSEATMVETGQDTIVTSEEQIQAPTEQEAPQPNEAPATEQPTSDTAPTIAPTDTPAETAPAGGQS